MRAYLQRLGGVGVSVVVQDDVVGHVEALPHTQVVEQGGLAEDVAHVDDRDVWREESDDDNNKGERR